MDIPILVGHDAKNSIGKIYSEGDNLRFEFFETVEITETIFFDIFPSVGVKIEDFEIKKGVRIIKSGTILEFSWPEAVPHKQ